MNEEWFDELTNGEPLLCSAVQMGIIESLLRISPLPEGEKMDIYNNIETYSEEEADCIISSLKKDVISTDPRDQWKRMFN